MRAGMMYLLGVASLMTHVCACAVGDPALEPAVAITSHPPDCCSPGIAGEVVGTAANVDTVETVVVLYAQTDSFYIQPFTDDFATEIQSDGTWSNSTHCGNRYAAILASRSWNPPPTLGELPPVDGVDILAVDWEPVRLISWSGQLWECKSHETCQIGPGPNYWSQSEENVWVDEGGSLHLRITNRDGKWLCPEIRTVDSFGYGNYSFLVQDGIGNLDPQAVLGLFVFETAAKEIDIEFTRCLDCPDNPDDSLNAQYVVQPYTSAGNCHRFWFAQNEEPSLHRFFWQPDSVLFESYRGSPLQLVHSWQYTVEAGIPSPGNEKAYLNLWLCGGNPPAGEVEVVVRSFQYDRALATESR